MASKFAVYSRMAEETARRITSSREQWTAFLTTASRLYKYSYPDQLMIFAQRPDATACAEYDLWNRTMRRYVKRGAKGIALVDTEGDVPKLRYVFDVSDTGERKNSRPVRLWEFQEAHREPIQEALERAFGISRRDGLEVQLSETAWALAEDYWETYRKEILDIVEGSFLEGYDEFNIGVTFRNAAAVSITYALCTRCTDHPDVYLEPEEFRDILDFNTGPAANVLGTAVSTLSSRVFREIEAAVRSYERSREEERRISHEERMDLHQERGLPDPGSETGSERTEASGQVRKDAPEFPPGEPSHTVQRAGADRKAVPAPAGDRGNRKSENGPADAGTAGEKSGPGQKEQPDGMGPAYEQPESAGRRNHSGGTDLPLSFFPSEAEQIRQIDRMAESEMPSAFLVSQEEIEQVLRQGSGYQDGKLRIHFLYQQEPDVGKRAEYLRQEYGTGGRSHRFLDGSSGFVDYRAKGMQIRRSGDRQEKQLTWNQVEQVLETLERQNRYLDAADREKLWKLEQAYAGNGRVLLPAPTHAFSTLESPLPKTEPEGMSLKAENPDQAENLDQTINTADRPPKPATGTMTRRGDTLILGTGEPAQQLEIPVSDGEWEELRRAIPDSSPIPARNFRITDDHLGEGGPKQKFNRNLEAVRMLFALESENRNATPEEQQILSGYVGWGGLPEAFDPEQPSWAAEYRELKELLSETEYESARASTLNAHYTSPVVIRAIYEAAARMGFQTGNILEPACGIGHFFGMLPESMQGSRLYGVELDSLSGRIARKLYPEAEITIAGFETTDRRDFYDLAVGNVPFGNYKVSDRSYDKLNFSIHNYFLAKALDQVRPGGLVAFVTSRYTMDQKSPEVRRYLAQRAELLGAVRLPRDAFRANAGTNVVSDLLFLQKREYPMEKEPDWVHLGQTPEGFAVNSYFVEHPDMVLGTLHAESTPYGKQEVTVLPLEGAVLADQLETAVRQLEGKYQAAALREAGEDAAESDREPGQQVLPAVPGVKNFSYTVWEGEVYFREHSRMHRVDLNETARGRVRGMVQLRGIVRELIDSQLEDAPEEAIAAKQRELSRAYEAFRSSYGLINS